jgi:macrolide-specific efflux system membrane fusion protein
MKPSSLPAVVRRPLQQIVAHRYISLTVLLILLALIAFWGWHKIYGAKDPHAVYQTVRVERGDIEDLVSATGTVQPLEYVDVGAQVSGQLKKLHIEVGSVVKEGDLLAEIDPTVFLATVDARRAGLRNQLATMKDRKAQLVLAQLQYDRQKHLMAADATTKETLQTAEATLQSAKAQIEALQAQIEQTQSTLRADEANLNYAKIYAPMNGTVVSLTARQGQTLNANQSAPTILRIADLSTMTVQAQVSEAEVGKLRQGMEVYFTTLGSQGQRWYGKLRKVEPTPTVTNNVVLYNALFDVPNKNQLLMPSMTTQVFFIASSARNALLVPAAAVSVGDSSGRSRNRKNKSEAKAADNADADKTQDAAANDKEKGKEKNKAAVPQADAQKSTTDRFAGMSREERRAALEKMTPEERDAIRKQRRAARENTAKADNEDTAADGAKAASGKDGQPAQDEINRGFADRSAVNMPPKQGMVKVIDKNGKIEKRRVTLGVSNRVQTQILDGLKEGDEVIIGKKQNTAKKNSAAGSVPRVMGGRGR